MRLTYLFRNLLLLSITSVLLYGCFSRANKKEGLLTNPTDSLRIDNFYLNVLMDNDTLNRKTQRGIIKLFFKIDDTLKISNKDKRSIYVTLGLVPNSENKNKIEEVIKVSKEVNFSPINSKDTIKIPFSITPNFLGKGLITGIITDKYFLNLYYGEEKVRMLTYEKVFEKEVYIK